MDFVFRSGLKGRLPRLFRQLSVPSESSLALFFGWLRTGVIPKLRAYGKRLAVFLETTVSSLGTGLRSSVLTEELAYLKQIPVAADARALLGLLRASLPELPASSQELTQLTSHFATLCLF